MKRITFTLVLSFFCFTAFTQEIEPPREQRSLVTKLTATWCPICGDSAWDTYANLVNDLEGKAVMLAAHYSSSSDLHSTAAYELIGAYKGSPSGQPIFYFNRDKVTSNVENEMKNKVNAAFTASPMAQAGIRLEYDSGARELVVKTRTEFFQSANGEFLLSVFLVEKEVIANQAGRGSNMTHKRVLRKALTAETLGDAIASGAINAGATFDLTVRTSMTSLLDAGKYQVATVLWEKTGDERTFVNANTQEGIEAFTTPVFAVDALPVSLEIQPNPVTQEALITIQGIADLGSFQLNLFNTTGQLLQTWRGEDFAGPEFKMILDRAQFPQPGVYFLQLVGEQGVLGKKIMVR